MPWRRRVKNAHPQAVAAGMRCNMVTKHEYLAIVGQPIRVPALWDELAWLYACHMVDNADSLGLRPYFDYDVDPIIPGGLRNHRKGKLAEFLFQTWLEDHDIPYMARCLSPTPRPLHVDYYILVEDTWVGVDVKSGTLRGETFMDKAGDLDFYGMPVALEQVGPNLADLLVYVLFDHGLKHGALIGYATRDMVTDPALPVHFPPRVPHACKIVPISRLHGMDTLKTGDIKCEVRA